MKIISDFQDFYDHAVHPTQIDPNIRYIRRTSEVPHSFERKLPASIGRLFRFSYDIYAEDKPKGHKQCDVHSAMLTIGRKAFHILIGEQQHCYSSVESYKKFIVKLHQNSDGGPFSPQKGEVRNFELLKNWSWNYKEKKIPSLSNLDNYDATELNFHYETPVNLFYLHSRDKIMVIKNPCLKNLNVINFLDLYQTWQEISMWIGGVMPGQQSPMVELSDTSKIEKQGFDKVYGFRKRPEK